MEYSTLRFGCFHSLTSNTYFGKIMTFPPAVVSRLVMKYCGGISMGLLIGSVSFQEAQDLWTRASLINWRALSPLRGQPSVYEDE